MGAHVAYCMGDSLTAGALCEAGRYPNTLKAYLETLPTQTWTVHNKGIGGNTTAQMLARFTADVITPGDAEYVMIWGGINDIGGQIATAVTEANLQAMYTMAHNAGITVVALYLSPITVSLWTQHKHDDILDLNTWIANSAVNVDYKVNVYIPLEGATGYLSGDYTDDPYGVHLNCAGYDKVAETVFNNVTWPDDHVDVSLDLSTVAATASFKPLENVGTWGIDIELGTVGAYEPPDGDMVNFEPQLYTPVAWNMVNAQFGSGMDLPRVGIGSDYVLELGDAVAIEMSMIDLVGILITPYFYEPPDGDHVNFAPEVYTPVAWNMVNWVWPLHCTLDMASVGDMAVALGDIEFLTDQNLSLDSVSILLALSQFVLQTDVVMTLLDFGIDASWPDISLRTDALLSFGSVDIDALFMGLRTLTIDNRPDLRAWFNSDEITVSMQSDELRASFYPDELEIMVSRVN